jgi:hypothetical protein
MKALFLRLLEDDDKAKALFNAICNRNHEWTQGRKSFDVDPNSFSSVPRTPFAYWVSEQLRCLFRTLPPFETEGRAARQGGINGDDFRWLRLWTETTQIEPSRSIPTAKGGKFSKYYADLPLCARWDCGRDTFMAFTGLPHRPSLKPASFDFYFRPGLTWPRRTQGGFSLRVMPAGCIFADKGPAAFVEHDDTSELLAFLGIMNSRAFEAMVDMQMSFGSYEVGVLQRTPVPRLTVVSRTELGRLARRAWLLQRSLDHRTETSHAFTLPALLGVAGADVGTRASTWSEHVHTIESELAEIQAEIDERCFVLYGFEEADRRTIIEGFGPRDSEQALSDGSTDTDDDVEYDEESESATDSTALATELVSWAMGVACGRFDVRLATGMLPLPCDPEPFDPLPASSPGMLDSGDGLPLARPPAGYPLGFPETGVLADDPGHTQDLKFALRAVFEVVFGLDADRWWNDVVSLLDPKSHDLRTWLSGRFFEHHIKYYSKSRRKAPIYWQLATPSGSFSLWLYAHRLTRDSFFQIQKDIIAPKLLHEESELARIVRDAGSAPTSEQRKSIASQEMFVAELRAFRDEIARVAPLWNPTLDDGVVITSAPLWRLFPHHKTWQKELKSYWDELCAGKYDWSHLAMHLWPERVVLICATNRSIAIAHGLEDVFWAEETKGKWKPRPKPTRPIEELVAERTSPAVKAALKSLIEAPIASTTSRRRRG